MRALIITMALMLAMPAYAACAPGQNCGQGYGGWAAQSPQPLYQQSYPPTSYPAPAPSYGYSGYGTPTVNPQSPNSYRPQRCDAYGRCY